MNRSEYIRRRLGFAALGLLALAAIRPVRGADVPEGIQLGRWVIAPTFSADYKAESNRDRTSEQNPDPDRRPESERSTEYAAELAAYMPFRNSLLEFGYEASKESFDKATFIRDISQEFDARLSLKFRNGDRLTISDRYTKDFVQISEDDFAEDQANDSEDIFRGEPYSYNRWAVEFTRSDVRMRGYRMRVSRLDYNYDGESVVALKDYRGFDNLFEYRQPLPGDKGLVFYYNPRRFNDYIPLGEVGDPFRKYRSDTLQVGLRGYLGDDHPFLVRIGYERLRQRYFADDRVSRFDGISGYVSGSVPIGGRTDLVLSLSRRSLPSNLDTYYINNRLRIEFDRDWSRSYRLGASFSAVRNAYGDEISVLECGGQTRDDFRVELEGDLSLRVHERLAFKLSANHERRNSNCAFTDYVDTEVRAGVTLGWF